MLEAADGGHPVALVTGAGRGIGRGIALALAAQGWAVAVNYRENAEAAAQTVDTIQANGGSAVAVQADIAQSADRERLVDETLRAFDRIDLLVNNAGMAPRQRMDLLEMGEASYDEVMAANLKGPFFLTQRVARVMIGQVEAGRGDPHPHLQSQSQPHPHPQIVNIGSISAYASSLNRGEYCLSKAGVGMMTALFADRLAPYGINVYEIRPGLIRTDMTSGVQARYDALIEDGLTPIRRWGAPDDIGKAVVAIAQGLFPFSTGAVLNVDGGFHLRRL